MVAYIYDDALCLHDVLYSVLPTTTTSYHYHQPQRHSSPTSHMMPYLATKSSLNAITYTQMQI